VHDWIDNATLIANINVKRCRGSWEWRRCRFSTSTHLNKS